MSLPILLILKCRNGLCQSGMRSVTAASCLVPLNGIAKERSGEYWQFFQFRMDMGETMPETGVNRWKQKEDQRQIGGKAQPAECSCGGAICALCASDGRTRYNALPRDNAAWNPRLDY
jgi:hypothetical protein